ncbi:ribonuclease E inhibitor RraB [Rhizobium vallis]|uniref:Ribonuclease E inhibitor RraB n=1 Tax=Rhizobium vallis TaxID=634290 RepID=A0A432PJE1_9HYPH|nr:ribonuclease E inhibitor RraB [Rhizobium vallis]RUM24502.1 ribonuclease E inhibitor RraB [Rhizobium vallis]
MLQGILFGIVTATILEPTGVDEVRLRAERKADADVLSSLQRNGDCSSIVRSIDLRFVGSKSSVLELSAASTELGFTVTQSVRMADSEVAIDLAIQSDARASSIDALTLTALKIEKRFNLRYDGWGTVAKTC